MRGGHEGNSVAVLDWGIGGAGTLALLASSRAFAATGAELVYLSDSGFTPYGLAPRWELARRLCSIAEWLKRGGVSRLAVACNAMSVAVPDLEAADGPGNDFLILDIVRPGVEALLDTLGDDKITKRVGVIGGARTIRSLAWAGPLRRQGVQVRARVAQPLSALIERGQQGGGAFRDAAWKVCKPFAPGGQPSISVLALACTHYPAAASVFSSMLPGVRLFDPARSLAASVLSSLGISEAACAEADARSMAPAFPRIRAYTTGDPVASSEAALAAFGVSLDFRRQSRELE